jgi:hypothetical protein
MKNSIIPLFLISSLSFCSLAIAHPVNRWREVDFNHQPILADQPCITLWIDQEEINTSGITPADKRKGGDFCFPSNSGIHVPHSFIWEHCDVAGYRVGEYCNIILDNGEERVITK